MRNVADFVNAGCELSSPIGMFTLVHQRTSGDPCTTGCAYFRQGQCPAFRTLFPSKLAEHDAKRKSQERAQKQSRSRSEKGYARPTKKPFRW